LNPVPLELPIKASEAAALADLIFQHTGSKPLNDDVRARLSGRVAVLGLSSIRAYTGSLQRDPVQPGTFYIAADGLAYGKNQPLLLHMSQVSAPATALFPHALLIGRMRPGGGREVVVSAIPFAPSDHEQIRTFVEQVDPEFQPRSQGSQLTIEAGSAHPEITLPAAFDAFRSIQKSTNLNVACVSAQSAEFAMWAAIRAGWRAGYAVASEQPTEDAGFTRFSFTVENATEDGLAAVEAAYDRIARAKGSRKAFDFELRIDTGAPTTPEEMLFCLQGMRNRGRAPQLVAPRLGDIEALAPIARQFNAAMSIEAAPDMEPQSLQHIARLTAGRLNWRLTRELDRLAEPGARQTEYIVQTAEHLRG
jgi:hypothetical protein